MKSVGRAAQDPSLSRLLLLALVVACGPGAPQPTTNMPVEEERRRARDSDGDGVPDDRDACPNDPGDPDNEGAPGCPKKQVDACNGRARCTRFGETLSFARGSAALTSGEEATLARVARWLTSSPEVRIVEVRGFAKDTGGGKRELLVASERAARVCTWLVAHGVEAKRLVPRGFSNWPDAQLSSGVAFEVLDPSQSGCCE
jgi:outer membrane protein OmpA-like peptidoglycan-associated protein